MARQARLVVPGQAHFVIQRGHSGRVVFVDDDDRRQFLDALREASAEHRVSVHAYALAEDETQMLLTPSDALALSRMMQMLGRRYVSAYNRRHGVAGTLWDGRFRCAVVEPGDALLKALRLIDGHGGFSSAAQRSGGPREPVISDPPELWRLGNTPFEREAAYRALLAQGVAPEEARGLRHAALGGWVFGSPAFLAQLAAQADRALRPRARGRPARSASPHTR
jgi:putative transposase